MILLKKKRCEMNMTTEIAARQAGISRSAYSNIENGKRRPSPEVAKKLGAALGFDWTLFYADEGEKKESGQAVGA